MLLVHPLIPVSLASVNQDLLVMGRMFAMTLMNVRTVLQFAILMQLATTFLEVTLVPVRPIMRGQAKFAPLPITV